MTSSSVSSSATKMFLIFAINAFASNVLLLQSQPTGSRIPRVPSHKILASNNPHHANPRFRDFIEACRARVNATCIKEIIGHLHSKKTVSKACCGMLLSIGPDCQDTIHRSVQKRIPVDFVKKSKALWAKCEIINGPMFVRDYPKLPARNKHLN